MMFFLQRCVGVVAGVTLALGLGGEVWADVLRVPGDYVTIQEALDAAAEAGDEIIVAPGRYAETINLLGKEIVLRSSGGPDVTSIDASGLGQSVIACVSGESQNTVVEGFLITGGTSNRDFSYRGGGVRISSSSPTIRHCRFVGNEAAVGGGIYVSFGDPTITDCEFIENNAWDSGGAGIYCWSSNALVANCTFVENIAHNIDWWFCPGGGIYIGGQESDVTVHNSLFLGNEGQSGGGGICVVRNSNATISYCTIIDNEIDSGFGDGGGVYVYESDATIVGCVIFANEKNQVANYGARADVSYCNIQNSGGSGTKWKDSVGNDGGGNIDADPEFIDPLGGDFRLRGGSPCIDAGDNGAVPVGIATDLGGHPRFVDSRFISDTGEGEGPIVDMGAYENQGNVGPRVMLVPDPLRSGEGGLVGVVDARRFTKTYLVYSVKGLGELKVPFFNVTLGIRAPQLVGKSKMSDGAGIAVWSVEIPDEAMGVDVWLQVVQQNLRTDVLGTRID